MNPELIVQAIYDVWRGGTPIEEGVAAALVDLQNNSNPHDNLLPREYEVFLLLSAGESVDLICSKLNMSPRTVFNYQTTIRKKMALHSHIEFNQYALRHQLIQSSP
jgi:DNA-binding NarL/FixJ family response regulator